jgi:hypothetical protein
MRGSARWLVVREAEARFARKCFLRLAAVKKGHYPIKNKLPAKLPASRSAPSQFQNPR